MAQLRTHNRRVTIDNGQGHELTVVPKTRKPAEDYCPVANRLAYKVTDNRKAVATAGRSVVRFESAKNIETLARCKEYLANSREALMNHLLTCDDCK